jgi:hypothetical protein
MGPNRFYFDLTKIGQTLQRLDTIATTKNTPSALIGKVIDSANRRINCSVEETGFQPNNFSVLPIRHNISADFRIDSA